MIYVAGDTHTPIDIRKLNTKNFPEQKKMTKDDYLIILGDAGFLWENIMDKLELYWLNWMANKNFTTLLGNFFVPCFSNSFYFSTYNRFLLLQIRLTKKTKADTPTKSE